VKNRKIPLPPPFPPPPFEKGKAMKKSIWFFFTSFRRKPESSVFNALTIDWTPVFTGVTTETQFFHTFGGVRGILGKAFSNANVLRKTLVAESPSATRFPEFWVLQRFRVSGG
jgi:hypothetical protein